MQPILCFMSLSGIVYSVMVNVVRLCCKDILAACDILCFIVSVLLSVRQCRYRYPVFYVVVRLCHKDFWQHAMSHADLKTG